MALEEELNLMEKEIKSKFTEDIIKNLLILSELALKHCKLTRSLMNDMDSEEFKQQVYKEYRIDKLWYEEALKGKEQGLVTDWQFSNIKDAYITVGKLVKNYTDFLD